MKRHRCYIACPISKGNLASNVNQATEAFVRLAKSGFAPFCPAWSVYAKPCRPDSVPTDDGAHILDSACLGYGTRNGCQEMSHSDWMGIDLFWVAVSDCVLRLPGESVGADMEVAHAKSLGIPVFHSVQECIDWTWGYVHPAA